MEEVAEQPDSDVEEEDVAKLSEDPDKIVKVEEAKKRIIALVHDKHRQDEYHQRLQAKLQRLDADLAQRREDVEGAQRTLQIERSKASDQASTDMRERSLKATLHDERIRDLLSESLFRKPPSENKSTCEIDTVLVSFVLPNDSVRYNLTFRLDSDTTIEELSTSACKYWGVDPNKYILKTMANSKCHGNLKVRECFLHGEITQLRLEMKTCDNTEVAEVELKGIQPKTAKKKRPGGKGGIRFNKDGVERIQKFGDNYASYLKKLGGIYLLLKVRDSKPSEHATKIKLHDCMAFLLLAALTFGVYCERRPARNDYWFVKGLEDAFMREIPIPASNETPPGATWEKKVPSFKDVRELLDVWWWLNTSMERIIVDLDNTTLLPGYVSVRTQRVKQICSNCSLTTFCLASNKDLVRSLPNASCEYETITDATQDAELDADLYSYWVDVSANTPAVGFYGPSNPGQWVDGSTRLREAKVGMIYGELGWYDGSGYMLEYRTGAVDLSDRAQTFRADMQKLEQFEWISRRTRVVVISTTAYHFDFDRWASVQLVFEQAAGGVISPSYKIIPFKPALQESAQELRHTYLDVTRLIIGIYIFVIVGIIERKHKTKNHKAGFFYHISLNGITDLGIVTCILTVVTWRLVAFKTSTGVFFDRVYDSYGSNQQGFYSSFDLAEAYNSIFHVEGVLFTLIMLRLLSLFRLSHTVYLLWHSLGVALKPYMFMIIAFAPLVFGIINLAHTVWGGEVKAFDSLAKSLMEVYCFTTGDMDVLDLLPTHTAWTWLFIIIVFFVVKYVVFGVFTAIVVDAYYIVQLTCNQSREVWDLKRVFTWAIPPVVLNIVQTLFSHSPQDSQS